MTSWRDQLNDLLALARKYPSPALQRIEAMSLNYEQEDPARRFIELALAALKDALIERNIYQDFYRDVLGRARLASAQRLPTPKNQADEAPADRAADMKSAAKDERSTPNSVTFPRDAFGSHVIGIYGQGAFRHEV